MLEKQGLFRAVPPLLLRYILETGHGLFQRSHVSGIALFALIQFVGQTLPSSLQSATITVSCSHLEPQTHTTYAALYGILFYWIQSVRSLPFCQQHCKVVISPKPQYLLASHLQMQFSTEESTTCRKASIDSDRILRASHLCLYCAVLQVSMSLVRMARSSSTSLLSLYLLGLTLALRADIGEPFLEAYESARRLRGEHL